MPANVKLTLSAIVLVVAGLAAWFFAGAGKAAAEYAAIFLGLFMVVSMWIFPEVTKGRGGS
jgi:hypothetical protein